MKALHSRRARFCLVLAFLAVMLGNLGRYLVLAPSMWANAVLFGNQSGIVCCCLVLVLCCLDRHPVLAGVLLAFAMCKPQIAFVFFLPLFCRRRWQPIAVAGALVLGAWGAASLATGTAPLTMLWDMLNQGLGYTSSYFGLFNFLLGFGAPTWLVLGLDIVAGMAVFAAGAALLRRRGLWPDWLAWFALAAVVSVLWFYKQNHDYIILLLPAVAIFCRRALRPMDLAAMTICLINVISYGLPWLFVLLGGRRGAAMPWGRLVEAIALVAALHRVMAALCEEDGLPAKPVPQGRRLMER